MTNETGRSENQVAGPASTPAGATSNSTPSPATTPAGSHAAPEPGLLRGTVIHNVVREVDHSAILANPVPAPWPPSLNADGTIATGATPAPDN